MTTQQFFDLLVEHPTKEFLFEYAAGTFVPTAYHITEVKNVQIESVDCGGRPDSYAQTIIQLWWNGTEQQERAMTGTKALKIMDIVDKTKPINRETPIFFEWGHGDLRTSNYEVEQVAVQEDKVIIQLFVAPTVCKPVYELQLAGVSKKVSEKACGIGGNVKCC